jgi:hypothetical protein
VDGDPVATWPDSGGSGFDATATGSTRPTFKTGIAPSGKPIVRFDGSDDLMATANGATAGISTAVTIFIVQRTNVVQASAPLFAYQTTPADNRIGMHIPYIDGNVYFDFGDWTTSRASGPWGGNTTDFFVWTFIAGGGTNAIYRNGTFVAWNTLSTDNFTAGGVVPFTIGGAIAAGTPQLFENSDKAEIIVSPTRLNGTDQANIEKFLGDKWGITVAGGTAVDPATFTGLIRWQADALLGRAGTVAVIKSAVIRSATDALTTSEAATRARSLSRSATDALTISEVTSKAAAYPRTVTDNPTTAEVVAKTATHPRSATDALTTAETIANTAAHPRTATDALTTTEAITKSATHPRTTVESLATAEAITRTAPKTRTATDALATAEAATAARGAQSLTRTASEALATAESVIRLAPKTRTATDALTTTEAASGIKVFNRTATDALAIGAGQQFGIGIVYLTNSDQAGDPIHDLTPDPMWANAAADGVAMRSAWDRMEPHEHVNATDYYFGFFDQAMSLGAASSKKMSLLVTAGVTAPAWIFAAGATRFDVTTAFTTIAAGSNGASLPQSTIFVANQVGPGTGGTIYVTTSAGTQTVTYTGRTGTSYTGCSGGTGSMTTGNDVLYKEAMGLPWNSIFQSKWGAFVQALATKYASAGLAYIVMGGFGRRAESYFVDTTADQTALDIQAGNDGYGSSVVNGVTIPPGLTAWLAGAKWCVTQYATLFPTTPFICDMGAPYPTTEGTVALQGLIDWGVANYKGRFGVKSDGLGPAGPPNGSIGQTAVQALSPITTVGYQFTLPQQPPNALTKLITSLDRGIGFGAHLIETYSGNMDDPTMFATLVDRGNVMTPTTTGDVVTRILVAFRAPTESLGIAQSVTATKFAFVTRNTLDALTIAESVAAVRTPRSITATATDALTTAEVASRASTKARTVSEAPTTAMTAGRAINAPRTTTDALGITELAIASRGAQSLTRTTADAPHTVEVATGVRGAQAISRTTTETLTTADVVTRTASWHYTTTDTLATNETLVASRFGIVTRTASDALSVAPQVANRVVTATRIASDTLAVVMVANKVQVLSRVATDMLTVGEFAGAEGTGFIFVAGSVAGSIPYVTVAGSNLKISVTNSALKGNVTGSNIKAPRTGSALKVEKTW